MWPVTSSTKPGTAPPEQEKTIPIYRLDAYGAGASVIGNMSEEPWNGLVFDANTVALRTPSSSVVHLRSLDGSVAACSTLEHQNDPEAVEIVQQIMMGPPPGLSPRRRSYGRQVKKAPHMECERLQGE